MSWARLALNNLGKRNLYALFLAAVILSLYIPAVRFGLIWDDPLYYQKVSLQSSLLQIFTSPQPPTYQFYRPLAVLYGHLFLSPTGVVNAPLAHLFQIAAHLLATLVLVPVLEAFRLETRHAQLAALCFAIFPLSYYGVAWEQNQQPLMLLWLLVAVWAAQQFCQRRSLLFLGLSLLAYLAALLFQEGAAPYVFIFFWLTLLHTWENPQRHWRWWPVLHLMLVAVYALIWLSMPTQRSVTGHGFQPMVLAYLLQGIVFPISHLLASWATQWPLNVLLGGLLFLWILLTFGLWKLKSRSSSVLSVFWIVVGVLPLWAGLSWEYAQFGARLLYPAALGIAILWGGWMALVFSDAGWRRILGSVVLILVVSVSLKQWWTFQRLFQTGTQHLANAVQVLSASPDQRLLFVNFPDRVELRSREYPLGFWGLVLAPIIQNLSDYTRAEKGQSGEDQSLAAFQVGAGDRQTWPYRVDMRGVDSNPAKLFEAAERANAVYLTDYLLDGSLRLHEVGTIRKAVSPLLKPLAHLGDVADLVEAQVLSQKEELYLRLIWRCQRPLQPEDTVFVHLWREGAFVSGEDGDSLGGLVPLSAWQPGKEIVDLRRIALDNFEPGTYEVHIGIYNRASGLRYVTMMASDNSVSENGAVIGEFSVEAR
jgi:hypothetical protein